MLGRRGRPFLPQLLGQRLLVFGFGGLFEAEVPLDFTVSLYIILRSDSHAYNDMIITFFFVRFRPRLREITLRWTEYERVRRDGTYGNK